MKAPCCATSRACQYCRMEKKEKHANDIRVKREIYHRESGVEYDRYIRMIREYYMMSLRD